MEEDSGIKLWGSSRDSNTIKLQRLQWNTLHSTLNVVRTVCAKSCHPPSLQTAMSKKESTPKVLRIDTSYCFPREKAETICSADLP